MMGFASCRPRFMFASISSRLAPPCLVVLAALAAMPAARAAEKAPARAPTAPAAKADALLTPAQLQECVNRKGRLQAQTDDALKDKAAIEADKAEIARSGTSLAEERTTLDRTSETAVDAYNAKVGQREKLIETYQARVTAYNVKAEAVLATKEDYEKSCENRRYDERDLNDIKRKK
jgi:hypothetical protein